MNTIDDLTHTLRAHAPAEDTELVGRPGAVRGRVRAVRRRRVAAGAALAAALVAGTLAVTALPLNGDEPGPADRPGRPTELLGTDVPETVQYQGYTFEYLAGVQTRDGATRAVAELPPSDRPLVVSWVSDGRVRVDVDAVRQARGPAGTFTTTRLLVDDPATSSFPADALIGIESDGPVGLAVYELSATPPPGVSKDGITFRQQVADRGEDGVTERTLVDAVVGDVGQREVSMEIVVPEHPELADFCQSELTFRDRDVPTPYAVAYVDDVWLIEGGWGCRSDVGGSLTAADAGWVANPDVRPKVPGLTVTRYRADGSAIRRTYAPGEKVTVTVRVEDADFGEYEGTVPGLQLGVGIYAAE